VVRAVGVLVGGRRGVASEGRERACVGRRIGRATDFLLLGTARPLSLPHPPLVFKPCRKRHSYLFFPSSILACCRQTTNIEIARPPFPRCSRRRLSTSSGGLLYIPRRWPRYRIAIHCINFVGDSSGSGRIFTSATHLASCSQSTFVTHTHTHSYTRTQSTSSIAFSVIDRGRSLAGSSFPQPFSFSSSSLRCSSLSQSLLPPSAPRSLVLCFFIWPSWPSVRNKRV